MIRTLLADETRRVARWLGGLTGVAVLSVSLLTGIALWLGNALGSTTAVIALLISVSYAGGSQLVFAGLFYRSCYTTTAYLTLSVPVRGRTVFWVKFAVGAVANLISGGIGLALAAFAGVGLLRAQGVNWESLTQAWAQLCAVVADAPAGIIWAIGVLLVCASMSGLVGYYFAASVGSEAWINKLGIAGPVLMWLALYVATQVVGLFGLFLPIHLVWPNGKPELYLGWLNVFTAAQDTVLPLGGFVGLILVAVVALWRAVISYDRRLDLR